MGSGPTIGDWGSLVEPQRLSKPSTFAATGVHHGYRQHTLQIVDAVTAWVSWLEPGGFVKPHHDASPYYQRWQFCVQPAGFLWYPDRTVTPEAGESFQVEHWRPHAVVNNTDRPRVHIVCDAPPADKTMTGSNFTLIPDYDAGVPYLADLIGAAT